ncbi:unnamed protein product, partial [Mesorhabditis belari]|uniref:Double-strand break repair protein n=1 Tax=Mesorhabditis belari TaxID=2138241 RepID=A0AAF3EBG4_9BILA
MNRIPQDVFSSSDDEGPSSSIVQPNMQDFGQKFTNNQTASFLQEAKDNTMGDDESNNIRILIASDIHVGYGEKKKVIDQDASRTLEEVLQIANERKVDMILLGGDLFHESNPTRTCVNKVISLLRKYCMNDNEVFLQFISDPTINFCQSQFDRVNYEDENLNVGLPVFTIHGNHDDMTGKGLTALDPLHEAGLLNLFGKFTETDNYVVSPILLRKGTTSLALYGIGSQRDDRLTRAFQAGTIQFPRPREDTESWFNLLVLHQNRPKRSTLRTTGAYLPDSYLPSFFDFVLWGHEHECKKDLEYVAPSSNLAGDGFFILQPGSTVATSLTKDEALAKHVFLLTVRDRSFKSEPIQLETVRQMVVDELTLDKLPRGVKIPAGGLRPNDANKPFHDELIITNKIKMMIEKAIRERRPRQPQLPLLRLKVTYQDEWAQLLPLNARRVGMSFVDLVANPAEMLTIRRIKTLKEKKPEKEGAVLAASERLTSVENMVSEAYKGEPLEDRLTVLTDAFMAETLKLCTEGEDDSAQSTKHINTQLEESIAKQISTLTDTVNRQASQRLEQIKQHKTIRIDSNLIEREIRSTLQHIKAKNYEKDYVDNISDTNRENFSQEDDSMMETSDSSCD